MPETPEEIEVMESRGDAPILLASANSFLARPSDLASSGIFLGPHIRNTRTTTAIITSCSGSSSANLIHTLQFSDPPSLDLRLGDDSHHVGIRAFCNRQDSGRSRKQLLPADQPAREEVH